MAHNIRVMFYITAVVSTGLFLLTVAGTSLGFLLLLPARSHCLFSPPVIRDRPPIPPSHSQAVLPDSPPEGYSYKRSIFNLVRNKAFVLLLVSYGESDASADDSFSSSVNLRSLEHMVRTVCRRFRSRLTQTGCVLVKHHQ